MGFSYHTLQIAPDDINKPILKTIKALLKSTLNPTINPSKLPGKNPEICYSENTSSYSRMNIYDQNNIP